MPLKYHGVSLLNISLKHILIFKTIKKVIATFLNGLLDGHDE